MGLPRRFLNLIMENRIRGIQSLRSINLDRQKFFNTRKPAQLPMGKGSESGGELQAAAAAAATWAPAVAACQKDDLAVLKNMKRIRLPSPVISFGAFASDLNDTRVHCFPVAENRILCTDQVGCCFLLEADSRCAVTMPRLHKPKSVPISIFIPSTDMEGILSRGPFLDDLDGGVDGSFLIMDRNPKPEAGCSEQFEAVLFRRCSLSHVSNSRHTCKLLPPPPYSRDTTCLNSCPEISSYGFVDGVSQIWISMKGFGTYCLDVVSYTWQEKGQWMLPFYGKFQYVPELKIWFGFSEDKLLAAADLSTVNSKPELLGTWKEFEAPEEWQEIQEPQLVNLGSGRFCVARFFCTRTANGMIGDELSDQHFAVLTGVEVVLPVQDANANYGNEKVTLVKHKSRYHKSSGIDDTITAVL